jgi:protein gp37
MSTDTSIEWATKTWSPLLGCQKAGGPGCDNCYAIRTVHRLSHSPRLRKPKPPAHRPP